MAREKVSKQYNTPSMPGYGEKRGRDDVSDVSLSIVHDLYYLLPVMVGEPAQRFDVVFDTGSSFFGLVTAPADSAAVQVRSCQGANMQADFPGFRVSCSDQMITYTCIVAACMCARGCFLIRGCVLRFACLLASVCAGEARQGDEEEVESPAAARGETLYPKP
jgi:hypothetical protein